MSGDADRVAVIIPNYNKEKTLRACLESAFTQSHRPAEVVVVDDASTDRSREIARDFPCKLVELPGNRGPSAARNTGVAASTAPLLFFMDSDTALAPDAIANAVRLLRDNPDCGMVQGIYEFEPLFHDGPVEVYKVAFEHYWRARTVVTGDAATLFSCSLLPRKVWEETGGMDEDLRNGEDVEFGTRMPQHYRLLATDTVLTRHDDDHRLLPLLWEQFVRSANAPMVMLKTHRRQRAGATGIRVEMMSLARLSYLDRTAWISFVLMALSLLTIPVGFVAPWALLITVLLLQGAFVAASHDFFRFVYRRKGLLFALFCAGLHIISHVVMTLGAGVGTLRALSAAVRARLLPQTSKSPAAVPE